MVIADFGSLSVASKAFLTELLQEKRDDIIEGAEVFILTNEPNYEEAKYLVRLGIKGYGNSHMLEVHLNDAVNAIFNGDIWLPPEYVQKVIEDYIRASKGKKVAIFKGFDNLTPKEREVAELITKGKTYADIADSLEITVRTVKAHTASIFEKCGVRDRMAFILKAQNS